MKAGTTLRSLFPEPCPRFAHDAGMALAIAAAFAFLWLGVGLIQAILPGDFGLLASCLFIFAAPVALIRGLNA